MTMKRYPSYMVPYIGLSPNVNVDELKGSCEFAIARRVDKPFCESDIKLMPDGTGIVRADSPLRGETFERVPNLSMTLLRHAKPISSAQYSLDMKSPKDNWTGGMVNPWMYRGKATKVNDCYLMVYLLGNLHGQPAPYQRRFNKRTDAVSVQDKYDNLKDDILKNSFSTKTLYNATGRILLKHSPTTLNYWHFELKLEKSEGGFVESVKYKEGEDPAKMNMRPSFVKYVLDNYLFKMFWVDYNPCNQDISDSCFYDRKVCYIKRWAAEFMNRCVFAMVPIVNVSQISEHLK